MCLKIRCDGESEKFCKIFWELNKAANKSLLLCSHLNGNSYLQLKDMDDVDMLTLVIQEMSKAFPSLMDTLLHERDM